MWMKTCVPKTATLYLISISPAMLVATQTYRPESEGTALTISILLPCSRSRRFSPTFTGDPSFSQVSEGGGWPAASHSSTRVLLTTTFFSTGPSTPPAMDGGTGEDKKVSVSSTVIYMITQGTSEYWQRQWCDEKQGKSQKKEITRTLTVDIQHVNLFGCSCHAGHPAGVASSIGHLHTRELQEVTSIDVLCLPAGQDGLAVLIPGDGGEGHAAHLTLQSDRVVQESRHLGGHVPSLYTGWHWEGKSRSELGITDSTILLCSSSFWIITNTPQQESLLLYIIEENLKSVSEIWSQVDKWTEFLLISVSCYLISFHNYKTCALLLQQSRFLQRWMSLLIQ